MTLLTGKQFFRIASLNISIRDVLRSKTRRGITRYYLYRVIPPLCRIFCGLETPPHTLVYLYGTTIAPRPCTRRFRCSVGKAEVNFHNSDMNAARKTVCFKFCTRMCSFMSATDGGKSCIFCEFAESKLVVQEAIFKLQVCIMCKKFQLFAPTRSSLRCF